MEVKECPVCKTIYQARCTTQIYCSERCGNSARGRRAYARRKPKTKVCKMCGKEFMPTTEFKTYCSVACQMKTTNAPRPKIKGICLGCGEEFLGKKGKQFCSERCRATFRRAETSGKPPMPKKEPKKRVSHINDINAQAKELGLSYGQLKALQYMQTHKFDKW